VRPGRLPISARRQICFGQSNGEQGSHVTATLTGLAAYQAM